MSVTIRDVSKKCGLSISAVSKALNNYSDVSEETRRRVLQAAEELGYYPNAVARSLKTNRTYNIGVILDDEMGDYLLHSYFVVILNGFKQEAERFGYTITLVNRNIGTRRYTFLDHCRYRNLDGVCVMCVDFFDPEIGDLVRSELPTVTIDHLFSGTDCVLSDNKKGMRDIMHYVISMGHRRIAYMYGIPASVTDARLTAFFETVHENRLELPDGYAIQSHYHSTHHAFEATQRLLALEPRPTCILMSDDYSALGGMEAIAQAGLRIPEDISIAGYDGISMLQKTRPRLTTVRQDAEMIGKRAAARLIERIENRSAPVGYPDVVPGALVEGETVAKI